MSGGHLRHLSHLSYVTSCSAGTIGTSRAGSGASSPFFMQVASAGEHLQAGGDCELSGATTVFLICASPEILEWILNGWGMEDIDFTLREATVVFSM